MADIKLTLKAARVNAGMTQNELAEKMGVSRVTVNTWERGKRKIGNSQFLNFCACCGIPPEIVERML